MNNDTSRVGRLPFRSVEGQAGTGRAATVVTKMRCHRRLRRATRIRSIGKLLIMVAQAKGKILASASAAGGSSMPGVDSVSAPPDRGVSGTPPCLAFADESAQQARRQQLHLLRRLETAQFVRLLYCCGDTLAANNRPIRPKRPLGCNVLSRSYRLASDIGWSSGRTVRTDRTLFYEERGCGGAVAPPRNHSSTSASASRSARSASFSSTPELESGPTAR
jgi:hypothetical protein